MSEQIDHKFTLEQFYRSAESFMYVQITAAFILVTTEIASIMKMNFAQGRGELCDLSYTSIGRSIRLSASTVKREVSKAIALGMYSRVDRTYDGRIVLKAGDWFTNRQSEGKFVKKRDAVKKCGTVDNSVNNLSRSVHSDLPPRSQRPTPLGHSDPLITNAFTNSLTKQLNAQQVNNLNSNSEEPQMRNPNYDPEQFDEEMISQDINDMPPKEFKQHFGKTVVKELKSVIKNPKYLVDKDKKHGKDALRELAKKLGRERDCNYNF